jgi:hypothetical protein
MQRLSGAQLLHDEEQACQRGEARAFEVLLALPEAHQSQGNEVGNQGSKTKQETKQGNAKHLGQ